MQSIISDHRLKRAFTWAQLCVLRVAAGLAELSFLHPLLPRWLRRRLQDDVSSLANIAATLIFLCACRRVALQRKGKTKRPAFAPRGYKLRARGGSWRAVVGSAVRRLLRGRSLGARLTLIANLLRDPEAAIAAHVRRLTRGFHRRGGLVLIFPARPQRRARARVADLVAIDSS